jgi:ABC-2 type transport system ATP-binding protein
VTGHAAIQVEGLSKVFKRSRVLDDVSLRIEAGERVALVGPNGSGKTTLIRCLLGEYACEGALSVGGGAPRARQVQTLRRIGFVPQTAPPLKMPVETLVRFVSRLCDSDTADVQRNAGRLGLDLQRVRRQSFDKLSGGQKQKLLIAIALRREVDLLIMDEPAANLDPEARRIFFELLADRDGHATMLISSHRLDEVAALVSRVLELDGGRITLDDRIAGAGSLDAVLRCHIELRRPEASATRAFLAWGLREADGGKVFDGTIAGPDRLRFLAVLARYSGLVSVFHLDETDGTGS